MHWTRLLAFVALFGAMQFAYTRLAAGGIESFVIEKATVLSTATLLNWFDPAAGVVADGARLAAPGGGLHVRAGCEGTDVALLLASSLLVAPLAWRWRLWGVGLGLAFVFALNQLRVITLFYAYRDHRGGFDLLHGTLLPLAMVLAAALFFLLWTGRSRQPRPA